MAPVKTFVNGGSVLPSDINSIQDDYEKIFAVYRRLIERGPQFSANGAGTYVLGPTGVQAPGAGAGAGWAFPLVASDYATSPRTTKLRIQVLLATNAVAPAVTFTFGLYQATAISGTSGNFPAITALGTVITGSTLAFGNPGANNGGATFSTSDFTIPADGIYVLGAALNGNMAANSSVMVNAALQVRNT